MKLDKILNSSNVCNKNNYHEVLAESLHSTKKSAINKVALRFEVGPGSNKAKKDLSKYTETNNSYLDCLKRYLNEDSRIEPTKAMLRLREDADLEVSIRLVQLTLSKLREEMVPEFVSLDTSDTNSNQSKNASKIKDIHLLCLRKCIEEDRFIGPTEAWNRLRTETGLEVANSTVQKALIKLRKEMSPEYTSPELSTSDSKAKSTHSYYRSKLKDSHVERLREYLNSNKHLKSIEAMNQLHKETGLIVSISTVNRALIRLREEMDIRRSSNNSSLSKNKKPSDRSKLESSHLKSFEVYLKDDRTITTSKVMKRLQGEVGLETSIKTIHNTLKRSRNEMSSEYTNLDTSAVKKSQSSNQLKIKDTHIQCLKRYLKENRFIGTTEAMNRLHAETGLAICPNTARTALIRSRKEIDIEHGNLVSSAGKNSLSRNISKLNDSHMQLLKTYFKEDRYIMPTRARDRLHEETGLEVSVTPVRRALINLRKQVIQEYKEITLSTSKSLESGKWYFGYSLHESHIEFLGKCLGKNNFIGPNQAKKKLKEEMGLEASLKSVKTALKRVRGKMYPNRFKSYSSAVNIQRKSYKPKDLHIKYLKKYLAENSFISPTEAKKKLDQETGLEIDLTLVNMSLKGIKKKMY